MVDVRCATRDSLRLCDMKSFQSELKSRPDEQVKALKLSLLSEGLLAPFFIWTDGEGTNWILDGHTRHMALKSLFVETNDDSMWFKDEFPVVYVEADSLDEAKKALLQITSSYGKVTKAGALKFCEGLEGYVAPSVARYVGKAVSFKEKAVKAPAPAQKSSIIVDNSAANGEGMVKMEILVPNAYEKAVRDLFNSVSYIKVV